MGTRTIMFMMMVVIMMLENLLTVTGAVYSMAMIMIVITRSARVTLGMVDFLLDLILVAMAGAVNSMTVIMVMITGGARTLLLLFDFLNKLMMFAITSAIYCMALNDVIVLVRSVVLYFPSYEFSAQTLFQPPDQHIRDLRELQEFLNRILSIDVTSRIIKYPKIISFFDPVLGRSVVQRSVLKENLQSVSNLEKVIERSSQRLTTLENVLAQCMDLLRKAQRQEDVEGENGDP
eukprot:gene4286-biopygen693